MNPRVMACFNSLAFRLQFERGVLVSMCGDLLNVFLKKSGCFRDSEKRFGFRSLYVSSRSGFDLATAALYLLEIRSNSAELGSSINGLRQKSSMALGLRRPLNGTK